jgi:hypothetical protein
MKGNIHIFRPSRDIAFQVGFRANTPLYDAGRIVLPPVCVPSDIGTWKSATTAPDPDELPPALRVSSCGLVVGGPF